MGDPRLPADKSGKFRARLGGPLRDIAVAHVSVAGIGDVSRSASTFAGEFGKRPRDRYVGEAKRLLDVLDARLEGRSWIMGDTYAIADIATFWCTT
jgi:GST-like protein